MSRYSISAVCPADDNTNTRNTSCYGYYCSNSQTTLTIQTGATDLDNYTIDGGPLSGRTMCEYGRRRGSSNSSDRSLPPSSPPPYSASSTYYSSTFPPPPPYSSSSSGDDGAPKRKNSSTRQKLRSIFDSFRIKPMSDVQVERLLLQM